MKTYLKSSLLLLITILITITGCNLVRNSPDLSEILQIEKVHSIELENDWTGLSDMAPIEAHYSILPGQAEFTGQAKFSVGGYSGSPLTDTQDIQIPKDVIR